MGTGGEIYQYLASGKQVSVTGHSLGGHLAQAFNTLFGAQVSKAYGFSYPGIGINPNTQAFFTALDGSTLTNTAEKSTLAIRVIAGVNAPC